MEFDSLGSRIKNYESKHVHKIGPTVPFVIRLDGSNFSVFCEDFIKPFDLLFIKVMNLTSKDLLLRFFAQTSYTHSDEISLIFNRACSKEDHVSYLLAIAENEKNDVPDKIKMIFNKNCSAEQFNKFQNDKVEPTISEHLFSGRVEKLLSLTAAYTSVRFNYHLNNLIIENKNHYNQLFIEKIQNQSQIFDARMITFDDDYEIANHQYWRSVLDCERNAISTYARQYFTYDELFKKNAFAMKQMLRTKGIEWLDVPEYIKHGIYCKKEKQEIIINNDIDSNINDSNSNISKLNINTSIKNNNKIVFKTFKILAQEEYTNLLLNKYWINDIGINIDINTLKNKRR